MTEKASIIITQKESGIILSHSLCKQQAGPTPCPTRGGGGGSGVRGKLSFLCAFSSLLLQIHATWATEEAKHFKHEKHGGERGTRGTEKKAWEMCLVWEGPCCWCQTLCSPCLCLWLPFICGLPELSLYHKTCPYGQKDRKRRKDRRKKRICMPFTHALLMASLCLLPRPGGGIQCQ